MFEQLLLALKNRVCPEFIVLNVFFILQNFEQLALALKKCLPWKFSLHWNNDFWATCACSENRVFPEIFQVLNIVFTIRIFEQLVLALKKRVCPEFTVLNMHFLSFRILNSLHLPWKTEFALKFFTVLKYLLSSKIFEPLELALETEFALIFLSRVGGSPPASYATECTTV